MKLKLTHLILIPSVAFACIANASSDIASCSKLLPNNHEYEVNIKYAVKKGMPVQRFVSITDKNTKELTKAQSDEVAPFVNCVKEKLDK